jgi:hypothetical protein
VGLDAWLSCRAAWAVAGSRSAWLLVSAFAGIGGPGLQIVNFAGVEINQPEAWTVLTHPIRLCCRADVRRAMVLPSATTGLGHVPGVPAVGGPGLLTVLTVVPQPCLHTFGECRQVVPMPLFPTRRW